MINAEILADSINQQGDRITTMKVTFPRIVLAEFNTHRMFSRNSASSRAIPFEKMVKMVQENPFIPIAWQKDHKGMQGTEYVTDETDYGGAIARDKAWLLARDKAVEQAEDLYSMDTTKQIVNRLLEPFMWHTVIVTATEWENFFKLRCPLYYDRFRSKKDLLNRETEEYLSPFDDGNATLLDWLKINKGEAEIHISLLAEKMYDALNESTPKQLQPGEWHIPFGDNMDMIEISKIISKYEFDDFLIKDYSALNPMREAEIIMRKIAIARCARISYQTFGDDPKIDYEKDLKLFDKLASNGHTSPFEHVAKAMTDKEYLEYQRGKLSVSTYFANNEEDNYKYADIESDDCESGWCRNFKGFIQYRELLEE